jgi:hypothetical protein
MEEEEEEVVEEKVEEIVEVVELVEEVVKVEGEEVVKHTQWLPPAAEVSHPALEVELTGLGQPGGGDATSVSGMRLPCKAAKYGVEGIMDGAVVMLYGEDVENDELEYEVEIEKDSEEETGVEEDELEYEMEIEKDVEEETGVDDELDYEVEIEKESVEEGSDVEKYWNYWDELEYEVKNEFEDEREDNFNSEVKTKKDVETISDVEEVEFRKEMYGEALFSEGDEVRLSMEDIDRDGDDNSDSDSNGDSEKHSCGKNQKRRSVKEVDKDSIDRDIHYDRKSNGKAVKLKRSRGRPYTSKARGGSRGGGRGGKRKCRLDGGGNVVVERDPLVGAGDCSVGAKNVCVGGDEQVSNGGKEIGAVVHTDDIELSHFVSAAEETVFAGSSGHKTSFKKRKFPRGAFEVDDVPKKRKKKSLMFKCASKDQTSFCEKQTPYQAHMFSSSSKLSSNLLSAQIGPILFGVRNDVYNQLPVRISRRGSLDGVKELELVCKDALLNYDVESVKIDKYILVKKGKIDILSESSDDGTDEMDCIDVSSRVKPNLSDHHGRKRLNVREEENSYVISLSDPSSFLQEGKYDFSDSVSRRAPDWLFEARDLAGNPRNIIAYPVVIVPQHLPPVQVPAQFQQLQQQLLQQPPAPLQGPNLVQYGPTPDVHTRHDTHGQRVAVVQVAIGAGPLTNREIRDINRGPQGVLGAGYVNNSAWNKLVPKLKLPNLLSDRDYKSFTSLSKNDFHEFTSNYVVPALQATGRRPYLATADSVAAVALHRSYKNPDLRTLAVNAGMSAETARLWSWIVWEYFRENCELLVMNRALSQNNNLARIYDMMVTASHADPIFMAMFGHLPLQWAQREAQRLGTQVGWLPGQVRVPQIFALCWDGQAIGIPKINDHEKQRRQFYDKNKKHSLLKISVSGSDGKCYFSLPLAACVTPANTDGELMAFLMTFEAAHNLQGGVREILSGLPGYMPINFGDKGLKRYLNRPGQSFEDMMDIISQQSNGLVLFRRPLDAADDYYDPDGNVHPPPQRHPQAPQNANSLMMALQANACSQSGKVRYSIENYHATMYHRKSTGVKETIDQALLDPVGVGVSGLITTPQTPKVSVLIDANIGIHHLYGTAQTTSFELPPHINRYSEIGHITLQRMWMSNWLDPLEIGLPSPFIRTDLFLQPRGPELRAALLMAGGVRMVNVLNPNDTNFPNVPVSHMNELGCGPFLPNRVRGYVTEMQGRISDQLPYLGLANFDFVRRQAPVFLPGWLFEQIQVPPGWNAQLYGPWEPVSVLTVPGIPSRYKSGTVHDHISIIAYVPVNRVLVNPAVGFLSPPLQRIKMMLCGPRKDGMCKLGARLSPPCVHNHTGIFLAGVLANNPGAHRSTFKCLHTVDAGINLRPAGYTFDVIQGLIG